MNLQISEMDGNLTGSALEIYRWYVRNSTATFQIEDPTEAQMKSLLFFEKREYRSFGVFSDGVFAGYGIVTRFKEREAFKGTAEVTIYLGSEYTGKGIGRILLAHLEEHCKVHGFHALVALVTGENEGSCALFSRSGYEECARFREVGMKFGRLLDLVCFEKILPAS